MEMFEETVLGQKQNRYGHPTQLHRPRDLLLERNNRPWCVKVRFRSTSAPPNADQLSTTAPAPSHSCSKACSPITEGACYQLAAPRVHDLGCVMHEILHDSTVPTVGYSTKYSMSKAERIVHLVPLVTFVSKYSLTARFRPSLLLASHSLS